MKWEITGGTKREWNHHRSWWVMTYMHEFVMNGPKPSGPHLIKTFDAGGRLVLCLFEGLKPFIERDVIEGRALWVPEEIVWARMPAEMPEAPNVEMLYEKNPWTGD